MQFSFKKINIESPTPTTQFGHSCQTYKLHEYHDHLYARAAGFKDGDNWIIHISLDLLCLRLDPRNELENKIRKACGDENIHIITSTTHTHYANNPQDDEYEPWLLDTIAKGVASMEYKEYENVETSYQRIHTKTLGKSRISGYESENEHLTLVKFYENGKKFFTFVITNCHPTILQATVPFFSAEYPGYILKKLEDNYPNECFSFIQGAAGDISTRFTRDGQDYDALVRLADKFYLELDALCNEDAIRKPFKLDFKEIKLPFEYDFGPIDMSNLRSDLTPRELETIKLGQEMREKYKDNIDKKGIFSVLAPYGLIAKLDFGTLKIVFVPNEIFSDYMNHIDLNEKMLVSYSNGYGPYVLPIDFPYITYEMFTDAMTKDTKLKLIETIKNI